MPDYPCGIYKISSDITGHCYVGKASKIGYRWHYHLKHWLNGEHTAKMQEMYDRDGLPNIRFEVIELCEPYQLDEREAYWIAELKPELNEHMPPCAKMADDNDLSRSELCQKCGINRRPVGQRYCRRCMRAIMQSADWRKYLSLPDPPPLRRKKGKSKAAPKPGYVSDYDYFKNRRRRMSTSK